METDTVPLELEFDFCPSDEESSVESLVNSDTLDDLLAREEEEDEEGEEEDTEEVEEAIAGVVVDGTMDNVSVGVAGVAATEATSASTVVVKTAYSEGTLNWVMLQALI